MNEIIKVGYLLSYDYQYIFNSLKLVYDFADKIVLCYDKDGKTWAGNDVSIPHSFFEEIRKIDIKNKISFYADSFYMENIPPMSLETRQRNMLAEKLGKGGWHIQIDSDEYPIDFKELTSFLRKHKYLLKKPEKTPVNFFVKFITLFKQTEDGFFVISPYTEPCFLITNQPNYKNARFPKNALHIDLDSYIIHQSWARDEEEILKKITNWGHKNDFDTKKFFDFWKNLNENNCTSLQNFHPLYPADWKSIKFIKAKNIEEVIDFFRTSKEFADKKITLPLKWKRRVKLYLKSLF
jgi:hypothetical protein